MAATAMNSAGSAVPLDGYSAPYMRAICYGSAFYGFVAIVLAARAARSLTGRGTAAAALIWIGTPLLFYAHIAPAMSHACSAFAVAVFVSVWLKVRGTWSVRGCLALGAAAALMAMVREQDAFFVVGPGLDILWRAWRVRGSSQFLDGEPAWTTPVRDASLSRLVVGLSAGAVVALGVFVPQLLAYQALNGRPGPSQLVQRKMSWGAPHALQVLGSPAHGLFVWTPLVVPALAGLVFIAAGDRRTKNLRYKKETDRRTEVLRHGQDVLRHKEEVPRSQSESDRTGICGAGLQPCDRHVVGLCMLAMVAVQVYIAGSVESWTVAGAFGQRRFVALTVLLTVGLAETMRRVGRARVPAALTLALCVWWNLGLIAQFGAGLMDRQRLELARNAYNTFVVIPQRLPELANRYLFNRESYYRPTPE